MTISLVILSLPLVQDMPPLTLLGRVLLIFWSLTTPVGFWAKNMKN